MDIVGVPPIECEGYNLDSKSGSGLRFAILNPMILRIKAGCEPA